MRSKGFTRAKSLGCSAAVLGLCLHAQQLPIKVPVRLVNVPTMVFAADGKLLTGLRKENFHVADNGREQNFKFETETPPLSIAIAVQSSQSARAYLPFISKVGSTLDNSLLGETGEAAVLAYDNDVEVLKPFGSGDVGQAIRKMKEGGEKARLIDAGLRAIDLLKNRPANRERLLIIIGQPFDSGSNAKFAALADAAQKENVTIFTFTLPMFGKNFISDTFTLSGYGSQGYKGGYVATVELTKLGPALKRSAQTAAKADPFASLTAQTGGMEIHFRKQKEVENGIIAMGGVLHSMYLLSYSPDPLTSGHHTIAVTTDIPGATAHTRSGYELNLPK